MKEMADHKPTVWSLALVFYLESDTDLYTYIYSSYTFASIPKKLILIISTLRFKTLCPDEGHKGFPYLDD